MIRALLYIVLVMVLYQAIKTVFRSAVASYGEDNGPRLRTGRITGGDMVLDPQCRTYVVKERAVVRRVKGTEVYFCSETCADEHVRSRRS